MREPSEDASPTLMEGSTMQHHHPQHLMMLYHQRLGDAVRAHQHREGLARRPRPPGRLRNRAAQVLVRVAVRLANEPVVVLPDRAPVR